MLNFGTCSGSMVHIPPQGYLFLCLVFPEKKCFSRSLALVLLIPDNTNFLPYRSLYQGSRQSLKISTQTAMFGQRFIDKLRSVRGRTKKIKKGNKLKGWHGWARERESTLALTRTSNLTSDTKTQAKKRG